MDKKNSVYVKSPLILKKSKQYKNLTILIINSSYKTYYKIRKSLIKLNLNYKEHIEYLNLNYFKIN